MEIGRPDSRLLHRSDEGGWGDGQIIVDKIE